MQQNEIWLRVWMLLLVYKCTFDMFHSIQVHLLLRCCWGDSRYSPVHQSFSQFGCSASAEFVFLKIQRYRECRNQCVSDLQIAQLLQRVQIVRDSFCTSIFGDFDQIEDLVYTFEEGSNQPITEDMLEEMEQQESGYDDQLVTRSRLQAACFVIDAMGEETRDRLINSFCVNQLKNYEQLFRPESAGEGLDQMERRFHWFWKTLSE